MQIIPTTCLADLKLVDASEIHVAHVVHEALPLAMPARLCVKPLAREPKVDEAERRIFKQVILWTFCLLRNLIV